MKDRDAFLDIMIRDYESNTKTSLSSHDPIFHAFNAVSNVADILSIYGDKEARERYIQTAKRRNSIIAMAIGYGYTPVSLEPDQHRVTINFADAIPEALPIVAGTRVRTETEDDEYTVAETMEDVIVPQGSTSYDVIVEVGRTTEEYIGDGEGIEKSLPLDGDYVYIDSLKLKVVTDLGTETWTKVDNFLKSNQDDQHFIVDLGAKSFNDMMKPNDLMLYLRCGDGTSGKVFPEGARVYAVYREVNPYQDTLPLNAFVDFEDGIMYVDSLTNVEVIKEKVLPEDTEIIRRNAIYTKSIGSSLETKEDFERGAITQSIDKIYKAYAEQEIVGGKIVTTIYVRGDEGVLLSQAYLDSVRDKMYTEYARNLNTEYILQEAPTQVETLNLTIVYEPDLAEETKTAIKSAIRDIVVDELRYLDLGQTYSVPIIWSSIMKETSDTLKGLSYLQITSVPPVVVYNAELKIPKENIVFTEA